ncbi:adenylate/guanylate cyclase domain-containing protein [Hypericibacter adhaerens]|uniref:Adenylate/guanylate cyclase domain-containing protein n=1 Tax=Hypericibacter adhaerens TaxID=2602016 RepID=A0A5J6MXZ2_9PROT|nr:adenylate/guanylate cyclase domain-containing protein [Hypericibacter adhaerens]QEX22201.1 adenylate/guanylate cyclase domain-containing protein [Hypericibacter adhaerens]
MTSTPRSGGPLFRVSTLMAVAGLILLVLVHRYGLPLFDSIEGSTLDGRFQLRGPVPAPDDVVIVAVDERALAEVGRWPLPRAKIAAALEELKRLGARSVGLDFLLSESEATGSGAGLSPGDMALREALEQNRCVLAMAALFERTMSGGQPVPGDLSAAGYRVVQKPASGGFLPSQATGALLPLADFRNVAAIGHVNLAPDRAGARRSFEPAIALGDTFVPSFAVQLARLQMGLGEDEIALSLNGWLQLGDRRIPLDSDLSAPIDYYGPTGSIRTYSLADLLAGSVPREAIAGHAVLLGATALGLGDRFITPFAREMPGVEVIATVAANLLHGPRLTRTGLMRAWELGAMLVLAGLAWLAATRRNPLLALGLTLAALLAWPAFCVLAFLQWHLWLNMVLPTFAALLTATILLPGRVIAELRLRREAERQRSNLARYVPAAMAAQLAAEGKAGFHEREQPAAILFADLSGFTQLSETQSPEDTARFLKAFHGRLEEVVLAHGGVIEQFVGDGAMVIFGLPQPRSEDPVSALACARALVATLARWQPKLTPRAGLHFGPVALARLGGATQSQLAVAGDTVNVASRLEDFAKQNGAAIAVSDAVMSAVAAAGRRDLQAGFWPLPDQAIRGREGRLTVWIAPAEAVVEAAATPAGDRAPGPAAKENLNPESS